MSSAAVRTDPQRRAPPFGKALFLRQWFANPPFLVAVCVGEGAFERAERWNVRANDGVGLVLPDAEPQRYIWPVAGSLCLIEWDQGPTDDLIGRLALCLHRAGALSVTSQCLFDQDNPHQTHFDTKTGKWDRMSRGMHFFRFDERRPVHVARS